MTYPDPSPHPTGDGPWGGRTVRDLIRAARQAGAIPYVYSGAFGREHVWTTAIWRIAYEPAGDLGVLYVKRRLPGPRLRYEQVAKVLVTLPGQAWAVLAALGVLPAAAPVLAGAA